MACLLSALAGCKVTDETVVYQSQFFPIAEIYRIPSLLKTGNGTLLAFAEKRKSYFDHGDKDIVVKRSFDEGETWYQLLTVTEKPSAYSDMAKLDDVSVGLLFEYWNSVIPYWSIVYRRVDIVDDD